MEELNENVPEMVVLASGALLDTASSSAAVSAAVTIPEGPFRPTWKSLENYQIPEWYLDAKFGIFIHWGVYSVPAFQNEWYSRLMYLRDEPAYKHHRETYGRHKQFGYKDFIPEFTVEKWDPAAWVELFKKSGARYVVPVAEHHDGFAMYNCSYTEWNAVRLGPKRDIIGQLAETIRKQGLHFGVSSHRAFNWSYYTFDDEFDTVDPANEGLYGKPHEPEVPAREEFLEDWLRRTVEIVDKYQPDLFWFDFCFNAPEFEAYRKQFAAYYYNRAAQWGRGVVINYKGEAFPSKAAVLDLERGKLDYLRPLYWQTDTSVCRKSWGYIRDHDYKSASSLIQDLVDIVSKNGCLLLNICPRPDGTIPEDQQQILLEIGKWLELNGEAIYGSRPWKVYGEGPTRIAAGPMKENEHKEFTSQDIRFTTKGDVIYVIFLGQPKEEMTIQSFSSNLRLYPEEIACVQLLGTDEPIEWLRDESGLKVNLPARKPCERAFTLRIKKRQ